MKDKKEKMSGKFDAPIYDKETMDAAKKALKDGKIEIRTDEIDLKRKS